MALSWVAIACYVFNDLIEEGKFEMSGFYCVAVCLVYRFVFMI